KAIVSFSIRHISDLTELQRRARKRDRDTGQRGHAFIRYVAFNARGVGKLCVGRRGRPQRDQQGDDDERSPDARADEPRNEPHSDAPYLCGLRRGREEMIVSPRVTVDGRRAAGCEYYGVCRGFATISNTCSRFERETIRNNSTRWMQCDRINRRM